MDNSLKNKFNLSEKKLALLEMLCSVKRETGEMVRRSVNVMNKYENNAEAIQKVFYRGWSGGGP